MKFTIIQRCDNFQLYVKEGTFHVHIATSRYRDILKTVADRYYKLATEEVNFVEEFSIGE